MSNVGLEAILADPSNDAPRLVWADREGGERGELVVIQCALAGRGISREERRRFKARETELLSSSWKYDGLGSNLRGTFVRGFVERVSGPLEALDDLWTHAPLCSFLELQLEAREVNMEVGPRPEEAWAEVAKRLEKAFAAFPPSRVLGISATASVSEVNAWRALSESIGDDGRNHFGCGDDFVRLVASAAPLSSVTELRIYGGEVSAHAIPQLAQLSRLRRLHGDFKLSGAEAVALLRAVPSLRQFAPLSSGLRGAELKTLLAAPEVARLTGLELHASSLEVEDLVQLGACTNLSGIERLGLGLEKAPTLEAITRAPQLARLEELNLSGFSSSLNGGALKQSSFAAGLRLLRAYGARVERDDVNALLSMPSLERVVLDVSPELKAALEAVIPEVEP